MPRIVAIEPNPERGALLRQLLRDAIDADVTLVTSTRQALTALSRRQPDLILASPILSPKDDHDLVNHLRRTPSLAHVPLLTIPPTISLEEPETDWLTRLRLRRPQPWWPVYDFDAVADRIEDAIEDSTFAAARAEREGHHPHVHMTEPAAPVAVVETDRTQCTAVAMRARAQRWDGWQLPWLSSVTLSQGIEVRLVNLSSTGLLVESTSRLTHGVSTTFELWGPYRRLTVPARIIRSEVGKVNTFGIRYHAAAVFDHAIDTMMSAGTTSIDPKARLFALAERLSAKAAAGGPSWEVRAEFESGVNALVAAHEVRLRDKPVAPKDGRESVYFTIPSATGPSVLQVIFEAGYEPRLEEFEALKAAAAAAALLLPAIDATREVKASARDAEGGVSEPLHLILPAPESAHG